MTIKVTEHHVRSAMRTLGYTAVAVPAVALSPAPMVFAAVAAVIIVYKAAQDQRMATRNVKSEREKDRIAFLDSVKSTLRKRKLPVTEDNIKLLAATLKVAWGESDHPNKEKVCAIFDDIIRNPR